MKRAIFTYLLVPVILLTSCGAPLNEDEVLTIGFIAPLTGNVATIGETVRNAAQMAFDELDPALKAKMDLIWEDDEFRPNKTVTAYNKLLNRDQVDVVVSFGSSTSNAVAPLAEENKTPLIAVATDPNVSNDRSYVVRHWVTVEEEMKLISEELVKRDYQRIGFIGAIHDFTTVAKGAMRDLYPHFDERVVLSEEFAMETKDFKTYIGAAREAKVDALFIILFPGQLGLFAKQTRELGLDVPLVGIETFEDDGEVAVAGGALEGQWYGTAADANQAFYDRYKDAHGKNPALGAGNAYDVIAMIAESVRLNGVSKDALNEYIHSVKGFDKGVLGSYSATGNNDFSLPAVLKVVKDGGYPKLYP